MNTAHRQDDAGIQGLDVATDRDLIAASGGSRRHVRIAVRAAAATKQQDRVPLQVAFALDRSGSMGGGKLELAAEGVRMAVGLLNERDHFAAVFFDDAVQVVVPVTSATPDARRRAGQACDQVQTGGSTNLAGGWAMACHELAGSLTPDHLGLCLLLTDGQANVGERDPERLAELARGMRQRGIATTCVGLGNDFHEPLLRGMAQAADGRFHFVEAASQLPALLAAELGEALEVVARGVAVEVRPLGRGWLTALPGFRSAWQGDHLRIDLGDLASQQEVVTAVAIDCPAGPDGEALTVEVRVVGPQGQVLLPPCAVTWRYAPGELLKRQPRDRRVDRTVAGLHAAEARMRAIALNRAGDFAQAAAQVRQVRERIASYAGDDAELLAMVAELADEVRETSAPMHEQARKSKYTMASHQQRSRLPDGSRRRSE